MKTLMILLTCLICFAPIYGQSKNHENKEEIKLVKLDSVQITNDNVLKELQQTIIPYMIKHKYSPDKYGISVGFSYSPEKDYFYFGAGILNINYINSSPIYTGYCIIEGYIILFAKRESCGCFRKVINKEKVFKTYDYIPDLDGTIEWYYVIAGDFIKLISHIEKW